MFQWLTFSTQPLQLEQLAETFAIDVNETPRFDPGRRLPEPRDIMTICSSLVTLTVDVYNFGELSEDDSEFSEDSQGSNTNSVAATVDPEGSSSQWSQPWRKFQHRTVNTYVRLAHFSVKEYLLSDRIQHRMAAHYSIRETESHGVIAEDCIAYILQFEEPGSLTSETLEESPLAHHAARYWPIHAKHAEKGPIESTTLLSMELLMSDGEGLLSWIRIENPDDDFYLPADLRKVSDDLASPLYYASKIGLFEPVKMLITRNLDISVRGGRLGNALQAASVSRNERVIQILIENGADVNARGGEFGTALIAACSLRREEGGDAVKMLLDKGADVNALGGSEGSALQAAISRRHENLVKMLLDRGADVNIATGHVDSALQLASDRGTENMVKMLLDRGADVNIMTGRDGSALRRASSSGRMNVVKMLLDNGADVNAWSEGSETSALQFASRRGHENVAKMLLAKGAVMTNEEMPKWEWMEKMIKDMVEL